MNPQKIRMTLQIVASVLAVATAVVAKLQEVDFTSAGTALGGIGLAIGYLFGKSHEAPGGVPKWKIPTNLQKYIQK